MIVLKAYPTGRPVWIDPDRVAAITDAVEVTPPRIAGADPGIVIVGTTLIVDGAPVTVAGEAEENAATIIAARPPRFVRLAS